MRAPQHGYDVEFQNQEGDGVRGVRAPLKRARKTQGWAGPEFPSRRRRAQLLRLGPPLVIVAIRRAQKAEAASGEGIYVSDSAGLK